MKLHFNLKKTLKKKCEKIIDNNKLLKIVGIGIIFKRGKLAFNKESKCTIWSD
jgi:hypothetical protein